MKSLVLFTLLISLCSLKREVEIVKWPTLEQYLQEKNDKVKVINFWATWCRPCMEELPHFEKIHRIYKDKNVEVVLVSLDQASMVNKVKISLDKNDITAKVLLLDEVDFNKWINRIDSTWSGSIPATLIIDKKLHQQFYEKQFTLHELEILIQSYNP